MHATEEAILNALCAAVDTDGVDDHVAPALPLQRTREIVAAYRAVGELASMEKPTAT